jgi:hypothetical protein
LFAATAGGTPTGYCVVRQGLTDLQLGRHGLETPML